MSRRDYDLDRRKAMLALIGTSCAICGERDVRVLCIHHVGLDGTKERSYLGRDTLYYWMLGRALNHPDAYQTLCITCHNRLHHPTAPRDAIIITDEERDTLLMRWRNIIHEARTPSQYLLEWRQRYPYP